MIGPAPEADLFAPSQRATMRLSAGGQDPLLEVNRQARFFVGNGLFGACGDRILREVAPSSGLPDAYIAGLFDRGPTSTNPILLVPAPDWRSLSLRTSQGPVAQRGAQIRRLRIDLDYSRGLLVSEYRYEAEQLVLQLRLLQATSHHERHLALQLVRLDVIEGEDILLVEGNIAASAPGLTRTEASAELGVWSTRETGLHLALATRLAVVPGDAAVTSLPTGAPRPWARHLVKGQSLSIIRTVIAARADTAIAAETEVRRRIGEPSNAVWPKILQDHLSAWRRRWRSSAPRIQGALDVSAALNYAVYHLNSAANPDDPAVSIGARGLTGQGYNGHVFWDTETLLLPYYCATWPEAARTLLLYRARTLDAARARAVSGGWRGALYAWESAQTGEDVTPSEALAPDRRVVPILSGCQEHHISADVALAVWRYWQWTGDDRFMLDHGVEILLETAEFWSSRAEVDGDAQFHIRNVMGPDEYHDTVDDNAFTNQMARWNLGLALQACQWLQRRHPAHWSAWSHQLDLTPERLGRWSRVRRRLVSGQDRSTGLYEQFAGFDALEPIDLNAYAGRTVPMDMILGRDRTRTTRVIKQADVVALAAFLPEIFSRDAAAANLEAYAPLCGHGSSLSAPTHALVAARLGRVEEALAYVRKTAALDLSDEAVGLSEGIHIGAMGGLWQAVVLGFAGITPGLTLQIWPRLPQSWDHLVVPLAWRGRRLRITISNRPRHIRVVQTAGPPLTLRIQGRTYDLARGRPAATPLEPAVDGATD